MKPAIRATIFYLLSVVPAFPAAQVPPSLQPVWREQIQNIRAVRLSESGNCVAVASLDRISLFSRTGRELWHWDFKKGNRFMTALNIAVSPNCDWLAVAGDPSYRYAWIAHRNGAMIPIRTADTPIGVAINHRGDLMALGTGGGDIWLVSSDGTKRTQHHFGYCCVEDVSFSSDDKAVLATRWGSVGVLFVDGRVQWNAQKAVNEIRSSKDLKTLVGWSEPNHGAGICWIGLFDERGKLLWMKLAPYGPRAIISPAGDLVVGPVNDNQNPTEEEAIANSNRESPLRLVSRPGDVLNTFSFEKEPFAAASIGQVHRARLKSGERVAMKIQYPGIARTIDADLRNLGALMFPARLGRDWNYVKGYFEEIQRMLQLEVDYEREAENLREAGAMFQPDEGIVVPRLYEKYSTKRVLTTEFIPGLHIQAFLDTKPSQALKNEFGAKLYTVWFRMYYASICYADPHSGNYLFMKDGRLGLLDFGCVQRYNAEERELQKLAERLLVDFSALPDVMRRARVPEKDIQDPELMRLTEEMSRWTMEPDRESPFDFGDEAHLKRGVELFTEISLKRRARCHPVYVYFYRSVFGLKALLYRLAAKVDVKTIHDRERW